LSSSLADSGWRAATASDGEAALAAIRREKPAAVVLDLMMPKVDGFEVLRTLRATPATRDLPVVVVTAKELTDEDRRRLADSAQAVILKHALRMDDLLAEIRRTLAQHRITRDNGGTKP